MNEITIHVENEGIEKYTLADYIQWYEPEIRAVFYRLYGKSLESMPKELLRSGIPMEQFLKALLALNNTKCQLFILMRLGFVTDSPMTLQDVAEKFAITEARARQIESMFMRAVRKVCSRKQHIALINDYFKENEKE